jgi:hypothetical protein
VNRGFTATPSGRPPPPRDLQFHSVLLPRDLSRAELCCWSRRATTLVIGVTLRRMTNPRLPVRPSVDQLFDTFPGRIYRPAAEEGVRILGTWGWGGLATDIHSLSLHYEVGRTREPIRITIAVSSTGRRRDADLLFSLLSGLLDAVAVRKTPAFPLVIERGKQRIRVDGRERVFTVYTAANAAVAAVRFGELRLSVECRRSRLATLELQPLKPDALRSIASFRPARLD